MAWRCRCGHAAGQRRAAAACGERWSSPLVPVHLSHAPSSCTPSRSLPTWTRRRASATAPPSPRRSERLLWLRWLTWPAVAVAAPAVPPAAALGSSAGDACRVARVVRHTCQPTQHARLCAGAAGRPPAAGGTRAGRGQRHRVGAPTWPTPAFFAAAAIVAVAASASAAAAAAATGAVLPPPLLSCRHCCWARVPTNRRLAPSRRHDRPAATSPPPVRCWRPATAPRARRSALSTSRVRGRAGAAGAAAAACLAQRAAVLGTLGWGGRAPRVPDRRPLSQRHLRCVSCRTASPGRAGRQGAAQHREGARPGPAAGRRCAAKPPSATQPRPLRPAACRRRRRLRCLAAAGSRCLLPRQLHQHHPFIACTHTPHPRLPPPTGRIELVVGDGRLGWPAGAPYDAIHVREASWLAGLLPGWPAVDGLAAAWEPAQGWELPWLQPPAACLPACKLPRPLCLRACAVDLDCPPPAGPHPGPPRRWAPPRRTCRRRWWSSWLRAGGWWCRWGPRAACRRAQSTGGRAGGRCRGGGVVCCRGKDCPPACLPACLPGRMASRRGGGPAGCGMPDQPTHSHTHPQSLVVLDKESEGGPAARMTLLDRSPLPTAVPGGAGQGCRGQDAQALRHVCGEPGTRTAGRLGCWGVGWAAAGGLRRATCESSTVCAGLGWLAHPITVHCLPLFPLLTQDVRAAVRQGAPAGPRLRQRLKLPLACPLSGGAPRPVRQTHDDVEPTAAPA